MLNLRRLQAVWLVAQGYRASTVASLLKAGRRWHGATFSDRYEKIENEFQSYPWYHPVAGRTLSQIEATFSEIELPNVKLLARLRDQKRPR